MSTKRQISADMLRRADELVKRTQGSPNERYAKAVYFAAEQLHVHRNPAYMKALQKLRRFPVAIDEFIDSPDFLGSDTPNPVMTVWPALRQDLREINSDQFLGEEHVYEAILAGATGWGKSAISTVTNLYQLYMLNCYEWPQEMFGLTRATPIVFMFQSITPTISERTLYKPFRSLFESMKFTKDYIHYNKRVEAELRLEHNILVTSATASINQMLGQAIIGGMLDEINFYARVEKSTRAVGPAGLGGVFDQAEENYTTITRRRKSRFQTQGPSPGVICTISSTRYKGDFTDRRIGEIRKKNEKNIVILRHKQYETVPPERFSGERFSLLVGTDNYGTRILEDFEQEGLHYPLGARIEQVPVEYKQDFARDPENALRDIIGEASNAITAFLPQRERIRKCVDLYEQTTLKNWTGKENYILKLDGPPTIDPTRLPTDKDKPRFVHVDLATTIDRCGVAVVRLDDEAFVSNGLEVLPKYVVECAFTLEPDKINQVDIADVRQFIINLKTKHGINISKVTYDGFNSKESIQQLRKAGIVAFNLSVDKTLEPYEYFKKCIYDARVKLPPNELLNFELTSLELDQRKNKVDHPPLASKDLSDAVCGAIYSASRGGNSRLLSSVLESDSVDANLDVYGVLKRRESIRRQAIRR